ncbi:stearoyl-CoA desaturase (delta-9 desaturase) [Lysobacter enzymogenes]|jgi:stearoyl-CoA desaturase (delta-9 desaturase)|uniref:Fatty acid desaturase n=1 Tax=Lysobacter enzymogenes TaxID=69 RepID=A0AAU9AN89_LYSEN|nr:fatty acid desaturase [Lysobacter enzymogenes]BAV95846.1 fatty acid desaturase [Lysobacter enzymogenes]SDX94638.1 stearoyl-CoA desaturase (delta-9 desaturase) [Lysobacter enzymogenes]
MPASLIDFLAGGLAQASFWELVVYLLVVTQLTILSVTLYLHRSMAHRSVDFHPVLAHFFRFWTWLTTSMITKEWAAIHRKHHAKCETEDDPHSPQFKGIDTVMWRGVELYRQARSEREDIEKYGKGCPDDWIERKLYTPWATMGPVVLLFASFALFGFAGVAIWALQMAWIPFWAAGVVNGLGHWWGYRNFETTDTATNLTPWGFWIGGEELHNNHHAFPSSAKFALRKWEFDIGWTAIRGLAALRLAKVLRVAPTLDVRPNIAMPDGETLKALLAIRFQAMTDFYRNVTLPTLREEAAHAGDRMRALPRRLRKGLADGGRWLDDGARARLQHWVEERPRMAQLADFRQRLAQVLDDRSHDAQATLQRLHAWCVEAEASGIQSLQAFSARLKGYALAPARY